MALLKTLPRNLVMGLIQLYRYCIPPAWRLGCRFQPTCSQYGLEAVKMHGALKGSVLIVKRIGKCHPFGPSGFDPVPQKKRI